MFNSIIFPLLLVVLLALLFSKTVCGKIAHWLNNLTGAPHPGPNDPQGACGCRQHEGPDSYKFGDYLKTISYGNKGFTLIELIIVVAIILTLAGMATNIIKGRTGGALKITVSTDKVVLPAPVAVDATITDPAKPVDPTAPSN